MGSTPFPSAPPSPYPGSGSIAFPSNSGCGCVVGTAQHTRPSEATPRGKSKSGDKAGAGHRAARLIELRRL